MAQQRSDGVPGGGSPAGAFEPLRLVSNLPDGTAEARVAIRPVSVPGSLPVLRGGGALTDTFGRRIKYLRVSVTDRCNLRCVYCMPHGMEWLPREEVLSYEEILRLLRVFISLGVTRVRLTGGEPLVRASVPDLVRRIAEIGGVEDLSLSTNGLLLADLAGDLRAAGLRRVNVSLDSLDPVKFREITQGGDIRKVMAGIDAALDAGLSPVKLNVVATRGVNDVEAAEFARLTIDRGVVVRFIEIMPLGDSAEFQDANFVSAEEILERIRSVGPLVPCEDVVGSGPARYYRFENAKGTIGVITPMSHTFCERCNRVRLTSVGHLRLCLFGDQEVDLRTPLRSGAGDDDLARLILYGMTIKPDSHHLVRGEPGCGLRALSQVGG
jgi:cyclic pyranopterin phosphate synthase